jgi:hypothetical protein
MLIEIGQVDSVDVPGESASTLKSYEYTDI